MIKTLYIIMMAIGIVSCSSISTRIFVEEIYPPITDNQPVIIYTSNQDLPDSSEYIGGVYVYFNPMGAGGYSNESMIESMEAEAKFNGGNAIKLDKDQNSENRRQLLKGKLYRIKPFERINFNLDSLKNRWNDSLNAKFVGIYSEELDYLGSKYEGYFAQYACMEYHDTNYVLVYLKGYEDLPRSLFGYWDLTRLWKQGDIYAYLNKTPNDNIFKTSFYTLNKAIDHGATLKFESGNLRFYANGGMGILRKVFPDTSVYEDFLGSLTGFAISNNRIITCYHGLTEEDARIYVKGINNNFNTKYEAVIEKYDKIKDMAVLKLVDSTVVLKNTIFSSKDEDKTTGDDVYVLGYPMTMIMGEEIKLTNGIVSSQSGFAGDITTYQISAPVQPGNSGAPVLDKSGSLVGMVNSKLMRADNVAYAIKIKFIENFLKENGYDSIFNVGEDISTSSLSDQIKKLKHFIYIIEIINTEEKKTQYERPERKSRSRSFKG